VVRSLCQCGATTGFEVSVHSECELSSSGCHVEKPCGAVLHREVWGGGQSKGENGLFIQGMQGETQVVQFLGKYGAKV
jgi:hypothetical protein